MNRIPHPKTLEGSINVLGTTEHSFLYFLAIAALSIGSTTIAYCSLYWRKMRSLTFKPVLAIDLAFALGIVGIAGGHDAYSKPLNAVLGEGGKVHFGIIVAIFLITIALTNGSLRRYSFTGLTGVVAGELLALAIFTAVPPSRLPLPTFSGAVGEVSWMLALGIVLICGTIAVSAPILRAFKRRRASQ